MQPFGWRTALKTAQEKALAGGKSPVIRRPHDSGLIALRMDAKVIE